MASIKKSSRTLITEKAEAEHQGQKGTCFNYEGVKYFVNFWRASELISVEWSAKHRCVTIVTREDFGGCGKDALKGIIRPLTQWLHEHCVLNPEGD